MRVHLMPSDETGGCGAQERIQNGLKEDHAFVATLTGHNTKSKRFAAVHSPQHLRAKIIEKCLLVLLLDIINFANDSLISQWS